MRRGRNEAETREELIDPALRAAGWGVVGHSHIRREVIAPGRLLGAGQKAKEEIADYVLVYRNQKLAVIEAKREGKAVTEGLAQAKHYALKLQTRFAFSTNGRGLYRADMHGGAEGEIARYPTPDELWQTVFGDSEAQEHYWRNRFSAIPFEDKGGQWRPRYYQHNAVEKALEALGRGQNRILLTLATGTGKTAIAFQIAWKLFHARWNLADWQKDLKPGQEPRRRPRILFLADRNILANQALNDFSAFPEDAIKRIEPDRIRKKGRVPKNASVFFTIFQTFMTGRDAEGNPKPNFGAYPPDFFDFIVIDECHRGGANDESTWRDILEYFAPAAQLGLTATPKRDKNVDTYDYFGEPVYVYALKEGVNDGYLTPFKVKQISTTLDDYVYTPDDEVLEGEIEPGKRYGEPDFNRIIEIKAREKKRVGLFMREIDQSRKTLVFCATQEHALAVRDLINQCSTSANPLYCVRVTADDGARGEQYFATFRDDEKTIPTILTTSRKLSTGVDARNVRNIVLMRPIHSMIEFKQIVGRGTRLFEGKDYFTIYDFVRAYEHFSDPEWDGEPEEPETVKPKTKVSDETGTYEPPSPGSETPKKIKIKLGDGKTRTIQHMVQTSFWNPDGTPLSSEQLVHKLFGELPALFKNEQELRAIWSRPDTRRKLLDGLEERGFGKDQLADLVQIVHAEDSDLFDALAYVAYSRPPVSRAERVRTHENLIFAERDDKQREFLAFVLNQYVGQGVEELDQEKLTPLLRLKYKDVDDAVSILGDPTEIRDLFVGFQQHLYARRAAA